MAHLDKLPERATLLDVFRTVPQVAELANALADAVLRAPGALSPAEREFLFAYVSGLNACHFCHGTHTAVAGALGADVAVLRAAVADSQAPEVEPRLRPLLAFVRKLTEAPARVTRSDADAVRAAGWSDDALHEAILCCALASFFNRWVEGTGADADDDWLAKAGAMLAAQRYSDPLPVADGDEGTAQGARS